jgi:hypothetical protein
MSVGTDPARPVIDEPRKLIGITPALAAYGRRRLLGVLQKAFPVRFEARAPTDMAGLDGLLVFASDDSQDGPQLQERSDSRCATLLAFSQPGEVSDREGVVVEFSADARIARPLRKRKLIEGCPQVRMPLVPLGGDLVLATADGRPVWWSRVDAGAWLQFSAFAAEELGEHEGLRDHLRVGRFMGLTSLLHFLWHVCGELNWSEQPLRASFVIDDPNLHWPSYGYLRYRDMVTHASRHGYHVGLATVPLDGWMATRRASSLVKDNPSALSLLIHGNDHISNELDRLHDEREAEMVLAQALRRIAALERRAGVTVERVIVPPHEVCSRTALNAAFRLGFDGACIGRRYPWRGQLPLSAVAHDPLVRWYPADMIGAGLPIVPRYPIDQAWQELVFRAVLGQPLILFAHHGDFAEGLDLLAEAADYVNGLGEVHWGSVGWIARQSFLTRHTADRFVVQLHSRRTVVEVPQGVTCMEIRTPESDGDPEWRHLVYGASRVSMAHAESGWTSGLLEARPGERLELALACDRPLDPARVASRGVGLWPGLRRVLAEGRDRIQPLRSKLPSQ